MGHIRATVVLIMALGLGVTACSTLTVQHPVGEPVPDEVGKTVEGWWGSHSKEKSPGEDIHVKYLTDGAIRLAWVEWKEKEKKFRLNELTGLLTRYEGGLYLHLREPETQQEAASAYLWFRVRPRESDTIVLWLPRVPAFAEAVKRGELAGQTIKNDERITASKAELEAFLKGHNPADLFRLEEPMVFIRMPLCPHQDAPDP